MKVVPVREVIDRYIGGGWGSETRTANFSEPAWVIRGTDFGAVQVGDVSTCPHRYHKPSNLTSRQLQDGDVVLEVSGGSKDQPVGRAVLVDAMTLGRFDGDVIPASFCKLVRPNRALVDPEYLIAFLRWLYDTREITQFQVQSTGISNFQFETFLDGQLMSLPALPTQGKIAAILTAYDDLIENNTARIKLLDEMARRIYREWFVDFHYPGHEAIRLVDSARGLIPEGWQVVRLGDAVEFVYGKALKADARRGGPVSVYGSSGVVGQHDEAISEGPSVIVGRKGNVGAVYWSDGPFFAIDTTYWVRSPLPLEYCYYALREMEFLDSHAAVPGLSRGQAYSLPLLVPDPGTVGTFAQIAGHALKLRRWWDTMNHNITQTRDFLLPRLISGEVDAENLDSAMPGLAA